LTKSSKANTKENSVVSENDVFKEITCPPLTSSLERAVVNQKGKPRHPLCRELLKKEACV
jgi:hypothetical protein